MQVKGQQSSFFKITFEKKYQGSFSAIKKSLETICPWETGVFAADRHRWAEGWGGQGTWLCLHWSLDKPRAAHLPCSSSILSGSPFVCCFPLD